MKKTIKRLLLSSALLFCIFVFPIRSYGESMILPDTDLIDIPTAGIIDYYGLQVKTRFYSGGGVLPGLTFGISRLNLGASAAVDRLIGTGSPVNIRRPELQIKYRFYDGGIMLPAFAIGYDSQGYYYNGSSKKYREKARGLYLVGSKEIGSPKFQIHPGINVSEFEGDKVFLFFGMNYNIEDVVTLMGEWDHIQRIDESRLNLGARFHVTPFFQVDFAVREIGINTMFEDGTTHKPERVVQLRYHTSF
jgi:hypothetical protein